jgi:hypothetical protein
VAFARFGYDTEPARQRDKTMIARAAPGPAEMLELWRALSVLDADRRLGQSGQWAKTAH